MTTTTDRKDTTMTEATKWYGDPHPCKTCGHLATVRVTGIGREASGWTYPAVDFYCDDHAETAPCLDCGTAIACIDEPWYAVDCGGVCIPCGKARGLSDDEYLMA